MPCQHRRRRRHPAEAEAGGPPPHQSSHQDISQFKEKALRIGAFVEPLCGRGRGCYQCAGSGGDGRGVGAHTCRRAERWGARRRHSAGAHLTNGRCLLFFFPRSDGRGHSTDTAHSTRARPFSFRFVSFRFISFRFVSFGGGRTEERRPTMPREEGVQRT